MNLASYIDSKLISFFSAKTRQEVLKRLVSLAKSQGKIHDETAFLKRVEAREALTSTGIGMGVAIPHAKDPALKDFFITMAVLEEGLDWNSLDERAVRLVFLIGGPDNKQNEYLKILSSLTTLVKDEEIRKKMLTLNSPTAMMKMLS